MLILFFTSSAFYRYLSLARQVPGAPARTVTDRHTHTMGARLIKLEGVTVWLAGSFLSTACLLKALYAVVWAEEGMPKQWRQGLIVSLYKKGDAEDPGIYRGNTLLNVVGKLFCKILNTRLVVRLESERGSGRI